MHLETNNVNDHLWFFSYTPMEPGIGGRLIEPVFENQEDYLDRATMLQEVEIRKNKCPVEAAIKAWQSRKD